MGEASELDAMLVASMTLPLKDEYKAEQGPVQGISRSRGRRKCNEMTQATER